MSSYKSKCQDSSKQKMPWDRASEENVLEVRKENQEKERVADSFQSTEEIFIMVRRALFLFD